jgi:hypothetical protein
LTVNYLKAGLAALLIVCLTILLLANRIDQTAAAGMLGLIVGLATGNGITVRTHGEDPDPIFMSKRRDRRATDRQLETEEP